MILEFFSAYFRKIPQISNFIKIHPVGAELFRADRRTERQRDMKLIIAFRNFPNAPGEKRKSVSHAVLHITHLENVCCVAEHVLRSWTQCNVAEHTCCVAEHVLCSWTHVLCSWTHVLCSWTHMLCSWTHVLCSWTYVLCSWTHVLCSWTRLPETWLTV
jgi:hypothetical protein